jgi:hypothetical protein
VDSPITRMICPFFTAKVFPVLLLMIDSLMIFTISSVLASIALANLLPYIKIYFTQSTKCDDQLSPGAILQINKRFF